MVSAADSAADSPADSPAPPSPLAAWDRALEDLAAAPLLHKGEKAEAVLNGLRVVLASHDARLRALEDLAGLAP